MAFCSWPSSRSSSRADGRRTPEYLGKKIEAPKCLAILALLVQPTLTLGFAAVAILLPSALAARQFGTAWTFRNSLCLCSTASDNGSAFGGLSANTLWFNVSTGIALLLGGSPRYSLLAMAGALAAKKKATVFAGPFPPMARFSFPPAWSDPGRHLLQFFPALGSARWRNIF